MDEELNTQPVQADNSTISYSESTPPSEPVQISEGNIPSVTLSEPTLASRALKTSFGVPSMNMDYDTMLNTFRTQGEQFVREQAVTAVDRAKSEQNSQIVTDTVTKLGRPLTLPESMMLQDLIRIKQSNPDAVIEDNYAKNYMDNLRKQAMEKPDSVLAEAFRKLPGATEQDFLKGTDYKSRMEKLLTWVENAEAAVEQQSYIGRAADFGKYALPLYQNWKLSGFTGGNPFALFMGADLDKQRADWFNMPMRDFDIKLPQTGRTLIAANPALALSYFSTMLHQASTEKAMNDAFPLLDVSTIASLIKGGTKLGLKASDAIRLSNEARTTVREYAKGVEANVTRAALHEATGDVQQAGVVQAAEDVIKNFQGKQVDSPLQALHSVFVSNLQKIASDDSPFVRGMRQETVNRIVERSAAMYEDVLDKVATSMKVDRLPAVIAFQRHYQAMADQMKSEYPHLANSIMDIKFRKDVLGQLWADIHMGDDGQKLFNTERQATNRIIEHSLGDAKPVAGTEDRLTTVTTKETKGGFRTEQGSEYKVNDSGTTTRNATKIRPDDVGVWKSADTDYPVKATGRTGVKDGVRYYEVELTGKGKKAGVGKTYVPESELTITKPGPSQSARGAQPASAKTYYLDVEDARRVFPPQGDYRIIDHGNGTVSTATPNKKGNWGVAPSQRNVPVSTTPGVGKVPLELFGKGEEFAKGALGYKRTHFGNLISEVLPGKESTTTIKNQGTGYYIVKTVPWTETNQVTRDLLLSHEATRTPGSMFNAYANGLVGKLRTPEETLPYLQNVARKVAAFGPSRFEQIINDSVKEISQLQGWSSWIPGTKTNRMWKDWERVMGLSWKVAHPEDGSIGVKPAFRDAGELNQLYLNTLHRSPSEPEIAAAFSYLRNHEILESFKKMQLLKMHTREGHQTWTINSLTAAKDTPRTGGYKTIEVEGKRILEMPGEGAVLVVRSGKLDSERVVNLSSLQGPKNKNRKALLESINAGEGNLIKLANPHDFPMKDWVGSQYVDYVYAENASSRAVDWSRLRTGRPNVYDHEHYVVQPIVHHDTLTGRHIYLGDRTLAAHNIGAMSRDVADKIDQIRLFLARDDVEGARNFHATTKLPQSFEQVHSWFQHDFTPEGLNVGPKLSLDQPIRSVPLGKTSMDLGKHELDLQATYGVNFRDATRANFGRFFEEDYAKARGNVGDPFDIFSLRNEGTKANPDYKMGDLKTMDPMVVFQRAMSKAINSVFMDDYKVSAVEHWIQEAKKWLTVPENSLAKAPTYWFYNAENHWKDLVPVEVKNALQISNMQIRQFLGIQDTATTWLHQMAQKLSDSLYDRGYAKAALVPAHLLPSLRDPFQAIRGFVFHPKVGLFAVPQLWVQASTFANIYGIAGPTFAAPATKAYTFWKWSQMNKNPAIMAELDAKASKQLIPGTARFLPGQFTEATEWLERSGFANVSREHIYQDRTNVYNFLGASKRSFLNAGSWFFEKGEESVRVGAWYAAYLEMRASLKTTGKLTEGQMQDVLQRADMLAGNMSRASASTLNKGVWSIPTQFQTFPLRMAELMLGKRLTQPERMRLFGTYSILYGIPGAFGLTGIPVGQYINKWAQENGYVTGAAENSYINTAVTEGLPSLLLGLTTGNYYNISERYSMQGFDVIKDVLRNDKTMLDILGGAAWSTFSGVLGASDGFWQSFLDGIKGEGKHPFKIEDAIDPLKEIASVSAGARLYAALNTGRWLTKKEGNITNVSPANAIFMTVFGLQPQGANDIVNQAWTRDDEKKAQAKGEQIFIREMRRSFQERDNGNYTQADQYESRAYHALRVSGYPQENYAKAMAAAAKDWEDMIARSSNDFYLRDVPEDQKPTRTDAYLKFLRTYYKGQ